MAAKTDSTKCNAIGGMFDACPANGAADESGDTPDRPSNRASPIDIGKTQDSTKLAEFNVQAGDMVAMKKASPVLEPRTLLFSGIGTQRIERG